MGARRSSGAVCFGRTGGVIYSRRTALGWRICFGRTAHGARVNSLFWVLCSCALTLRMFFIPLGSQLWLLTFCHQSKNIYRFRVLYFPPLKLKTPSHVCKIFRSLGKPVPNRHPPSKIQNNPKNSYFKHQWHLWNIRKMFLHIIYKINKHFQKIGLEK